MKNRKSFLFAVLLIAAACMPLSQAYAIRSATILYVGADWPGSSYKYATIQDAVTASIPGDEIWVEQGTYTLSSTIAISKSISLYGGFTGSETSRADRNWTTHVTTVDGNNSVRCFQFTITSTGTAVIDGFTITKGNTISDSSNGAGIANGIEGGSADGGNLTVANCIFTLNSSGKHGAISNETNGNLTVTNCTFSTNTAVNRAGGINQNTSAATMTVTGCTFSENSAGNGGAIYVRDTSIGDSSITDCVFSKNQATTGDGGAIIADQNITITRCTFDQNSGVRNGIFGGRGNKSAVFTNCVFSKNSTKFGVICLNGTGTLGTVKVMNCTFTGNTLISGGKGGAIYTTAPGGTGSVFTVTNSILWGNNGNAIERSGTTQLLPTVSYTDIDQTGYAGTISNSINQNPLFAGSSDYHLQAASHCIDNGTSVGAPSEDIEGTSRPQGGVFDMGAYEYICSTVYYRDADADGYGNAAVTTLACSAPTGYVSNSTDCDDTSAAKHPVDPDLTAPSGAGIAPLPSFTWQNKSPGTAPWYEVSVYSAAAGKYVANQWFEAASICSGGSCTTHLSAALFPGTFYWWLNTYGATSCGLQIQPGGKYKQITVTGCAGPALTAPTGTVPPGTRPAHTFTSNAEWVNLQIYSSTLGAVSSQWVDASVACPMGDCSVTPVSWIMALGPHWWWVNTYSAACGYQFQPDGNLGSYTIAPYIL